MPATRPPLFYGRFLSSEDLNFAFWTFSFEANLIEKWPGGGPPAAYATKARDLRYTLLVKGCTEVGASTLLTGQYADDQVETVLMRIATSSSLSGLRRPGHSSNARPFIGRPFTTRQACIDSTTNVCSK
eukprot:gene14050-32839_t